MELWSTHYSISFCLSTLFIFIFWFCLMFLQRCNGHLTNWIPPMVFSGKCHIFPVSFLCLVSAWMGFRNCYKLFTGFCISTLGSLYLGLWEDSGVDPFLVISAFRTQKTISCSYTMFHIRCATSLESLSGLGIIPELFHQGNQMKANILVVSEFGLSFLHEKTPWTSQYA